MGTMQGVYTIFNCKRGNYVNRLFWLNCFGGRFASSNVYE